MKKLPLILVLIILVAIAILPIIGNKFMQNKIQDEITLLSSHGLKLQKVETNESYLSTSKHFEFILEDSSEMMQLLNSYAQYQTSPYDNKLLNGFLIGLDVEYSNIPFAKTIDFDIYPLVMSKQMQTNMKAEDVKFYEQFSEFLQNKGLVYHVEYNLINNDFKGYIKDIQENYKLQNGSVLEMNLSAATFSGHGELINPESMKSKIKALHFKASEGNTSVVVALENFTASNTFRSYSEYKSELGANEFSFIIKGTDEDVSMIFHDFETKSSSSVKKDLVSVASKASLQSVDIASQKVTFSLKKLHNVVKISGLDKASFEEFVSLVASADNLNILGAQKHTQDLLTKLLSKGFIIDIKDFSLKNFVLNTHEDLKGFEIQAKMKIKEDTELAQKLQISPLLFLSNIELNSKVKLSKAMYKKLLLTSPMANSITSYAKEKNDEVVFDIEFENGAFSVNGKPIQ
ncbi:DUF945 family protein [Sulfurimonas sp.]|uniref:DUF945 family protein n=1 Tax=Sulfurimonas sp. TaxID=2022749 RepID=UPI0026110CBC|nr:DUF945 family protein [Sulfurimonas sp.]